MDRRITVFVIATALLLAACGDDAGESTTPDETAGATLTTVASTPEELAQDVQEQAQSKADDLFASAIPGSFEVDGQQYDGQTVRCEPFFFNEPNPDDLNVRSFSGGVFVEVDITHGDGFSMDGTTYDQQNFSVFLSRPGDGVTEQFDGNVTSDAEGNWYPAAEFIPVGEQTATPLAAPPFTLDGNHISGSLTVNQSWPEGATGTAEVSFDLPFQDEILDCSL
jgi:hypothetical protein